MPKRNPIMTAYDRIEDEPEELSEDLLDEEAAAEADEFTAEADAGEFTDEEVIEEVEKLDDARREALNRSRQRGRAQTRGRHATRETADRRANRARNPERERDVDWHPANTLEAPPARPGMEQRWIRFQLGDKNDPRNWARKLKERWTPRTLDTVDVQYAPPTVKHGQLGELIGVGDLILCERPAEIGRARRRYFRDKTQRQIAAAEHRHADKASHGKISVTAKRDRPTVGQGQRRRASVQDDE